MYVAAGICAAVALLVSLVMHCKHQQAIVALRQRVQRLKFQLAQAFKSKVGQHLLCKAASFVGKLPYHLASTCEQVWGLHGQSICKMSTSVLYVQSSCDSTVDLANILLGVSWQYSNLNCHPGQAVSSEYC